MSNINQWKFDSIPNSKVIITEEVLDHLQKLSGRTSWIASEHRASFFGRKLEGENTWLIDEINPHEDYENTGTNSLDPYEYSVSVGEEEFQEIENRVESNPGTVVLDIHTHPSELIEDYNFMSVGDVKADIAFNKIIANKGGTLFSGLLGCDRIEGNMTFSIIWYNQTNHHFYRIEDIYLRRKINSMDYADYPFIKYGNTQLIMQSWGDLDSAIDKKSKEELESYEYK